MPSPYLPPPRSTSRNSSPGRIPCRLLSPPGDAPWLEVSLDVDDDELLVQEDDIDREAHEERVHSRGLADQEALARAQPGLSEQPPEPCQRRLGDATLLADGTSSA